MQRQGADENISHILTDIPELENGLVFSGANILSPGYVMRWSRVQSKGNICIHRHVHKSHSLT